MSCTVTFNLHLDPVGRLLPSAEKVLSELQAAQFHRIDELTGLDVDGALVASSFLERGCGTDRGFGVVARGDCEMSVSFRAESNVEFLQMVALSFVDSYFRGSLMESRVTDVIQLVKRLHKVLGARRTIGERGLEDGLVAYDWIKEWHRLDRGSVEGLYWLDIVRTDLASAGYEATRRALAEKPIIFKRFCWGTYLRLRIAP